MLYHIPQKETETRTRAIAIMSAAAMAFVIGCADSITEPSTAPPVSVSSELVSPISIAALASSDPVPSVDDRILFDTRTSLQQASSLSAALALWGYTVTTKPQVDFTANMDGGGTHALRVDWTAAGGACTSQSPEIARALTKPAAKRVYMQWKQRLGRTETGGGVGAIGQFDVYRPECGKAGRYIWMAKLDGPADRAEVKWRGPEPVSPAVVIRGTATTVAPPAGVGFDPQAHVGETLVHTLYVQAQSADAVIDGVVRLWVNGQLVIDATGVATGVSGVYKLIFPWTSPAPIADQSEYFWDIVAWEPSATPPTPTTRLVITPQSALVLVGDTTRLSAALVKETGEIVPAEPVTWQSENPAVATVSSSGLVTGVTAGPVSITATSGDLSASASVTVTSVPVVPVATVDVTPASTSILDGQTVQLTATLKDATGAPLSGRVVTWASSNSGVATVSASGLVTGRTAGPATITATSEGKTGTATVTVSLTPVASISVNPASASLVAGRAVQLSASVRDASGNLLTGRTITWASSNSSIAAVNASGLVVGVAEGPAQITATCEGMSASAAITVLAAPSTGDCGAWPSAVYAPMPASAGQAFYVSPSGSDGNQGTIDAPWRTLQKAFDALQPGQIAYLRAGTYGAKCSAATFSRAGSASAPITVQGYPGERAVLNGQVRLEGSYMRLSHIIMEGPSCGSWGGSGKLGENLILMVPGRSHHIEVSHSEVFHGGWHAGIAAGGDDIWVLDNYIHDNGNFNDASQYNTSHGIYYHDGSRGVVANNILEHNFAKGLSARYSGNHIFVVNNTVVGNGRSGIDITESTNNWTFANNIVMNNGNKNGGVGIHTSGSSGGATNVLINNVLWNNGTSGSSHWESNSTKINNLVANPLFVNPVNLPPGPNHVGYSNDYRLTAASPAIGFALLTYALPSDEAGACRLFDGRADAGALERGP